MKNEIASEFFCLQNQWLEANREIANLVLFYETKVLYSGSNTDSAGIGSMALESECCVAHK